MARLLNNLLTAGLLNNLLMARLLNNRPMEESSTKIHMVEDIHRNRSNILRPRIIKEALDTVVQGIRTKVCPMPSNQAVCMVAMQWFQALVVRLA
jgi:hypothetical protein